MFCIRRRVILKSDHVLIFLFLFIAVSVAIFVSVDDGLYGTGGDGGHEKVVRKAAVSGAFYPASKDELSRVLGRYYDDAKGGDVAGDVRAVIAPHAGYVYSGSTAAFAYKGVAGKRTVIILAPSHYAYFKGVLISNVTHYRTPLGDVELAASADRVRKDLEMDGLFYTDDEADEKEHAVEVQIPFLQTRLNDFRIIPVIIGGGNDYPDLMKIADVLSKHANDETLIVASSDFTHYGQRYGYTPFSADVEEGIRGLDYGALDYIVKGDQKGFFSYVEDTGATICGSKAITVLLRMIDGMGLKGEMSHYDTSGRITGDFSNSVSYVSYVFFDDGSLSEDDGKHIVGLARQTLESYVADEKIPKADPDALSEKLAEKKGCFVTLKKNGVLRGCIGQIFPEKPLYECVMENAVNAAANDPRFEPVRTDELKDIEVEVSVLSVPRAVEFSSPDELLSLLVPLRDGVVLSSGFHRATYLPQVWEELPDKAEFLSSLCAKGGAREDCWKEKGVKVETYQAQVFSE